MPPILNNLSTSSKSEMLIDLVIKHPSLYDCNHPEYKDRRKNNEIWEMIGGEIFENVLETKKKWKNLKDNYVKYLKNAGLKTWMWSDQMEPLRPFCTPSKMHNIQICDVATVAVESNLFDNSLILKNAQCEENEISQDASLKNDPSPPPSPIPLNVIPTSSKLEHNLQSTPEKVAKHSKNKIRNRHEEIDAFFLSHASIVKTFSKRRQAITKMRIAQIIMEQELLYLKESVSEDISG